MTTIVPTSLQEGASSVDLLWENAHPWPRSGVQNITGKFTDYSMILVVGHSGQGYHTATIPLVLWQEGNWIMTYQTSATVYAGVSAKDDTSFNLVGSGAGGTIRKIYGIK